MLFANRMYHPILFFSKNINLTNRLLRIIADDNQIGRKIVIEVFRIHVYP